MEEKKVLVVLETTGKGINVGTLINSFFRSSSVHEAGWGWRDRREKAAEGASGRGDAADLYMEVGIQLKNLYLKATIVESV